MVAAGAPRRPTDSVPWASLPVAADLVVAIFGRGLWRAKAAAPSKVVLMLSFSRPEYLGANDFSGNISAIADLRTHGIQRRHRTLVLIVCVAINTSAVCGEWKGRGFWLIYT